MTSLKAPRLNSRAELHLAPERFAALRDLLARYSGVYLDTARQRVLTTGLMQRLEATGLTIDAYTAQLAQPAGRVELQRLAELVLNHETVFFRNGPHMQALRTVILPQLHQRKPPGMPVRIWSAGCATGEEPYSLAITALETLGFPLPRPVEVWGTDLSERALAQARAGAYRGRTLANVSPELQARYFERCGDSQVVNARVRALVDFTPVNLLEPFPSRADGVDLIFCQNVTIYFQLDTCRALMERFYAALPPGGMLFLGFSETLWNIFNGFRSQEIAGSFVYYKESLVPSLVQTTRSVAPEQPAARVVVAPPAPERARRVRPPPPLTTPARRPAADDENIALELMRQGRALLDAGEAAAALERLCQTPLNGAYAPQVLALIAHAHANRGDLDMAVAEARRALDLDSLTTEAYLLLGVLYAQQGQLLDAAQQLERARYLAPEAALVSFHLADVYRQLDRSAAAVREYRNALRKLEPHPPDELLDGVAVGWVRETCRRYIDILTSERR